MFKLFIYAFSLVVLLALNVVFPPIFTAVPNFLFLVVVFLSFQRDKSDFLWIALFSGFLIDVYSGTFFGTYTISFLFLAFLISQTSGTFLSADPSVPYMAVVIVVAYLLLVGMVFLLNAVGLKFNPNAIPLSDVYLTKKIWFDVILNLIFAFPVYTLITFLQKIIAKKENRKLEI